jgi:hypothetical protein
MRPYQPPRRQSTEQIAIDYLPNDRLVDCLDLLRFLRRKPDTLFQDGSPWALCLLDLQRCGLVPVAREFDGSMVCLGITQH